MSQPDLLRPPHPVRRADAPHPGYRSHGGRAAALGDRIVVPPARHVPDPRRRDVLRCMPSAARAGAACPLPHIVPWSHHARFPALVLPRDRRLRPAACEQPETPPGRITTATPAPAHLPEPPSWPTRTSPSSPASNHRSKPPNGRSGSVSKAASCAPPTPTRWPPCSPSTPPETFPRRSASSQTPCRRPERSRRTPWTPRTSSPPSSASGHARTSTSASAERSSGVLVPLPHSGVHRAGTNPPRTDAEPPEPCPSTR